jgi:hypothetical protein
MERLQVKDKETIGCAIGAAGCWIIGVIANVVFWGAVLYIGIWILKSQGVIR